MPSQDCTQIVDRHRAYFMTGVTHAVQWRQGQLSALLSMINEHEEELYQALWSDVKRNRVEAGVAEIQFLAKEIAYAKSHLQSWVQKTIVKTPWMFPFGKASVQYDPLGVCCIIGAWNYPLLLTLSPLIPAICGGNCAVLKPPELSLATTAVIEKYVPQYLDVNAFSVVTGGPVTVSRLLEQKFDHIFFTGSASVGSIVMAQAAKSVTPVVLELGGKNPTIVHESADVIVAARRIVQGRFLNAGQTCTAPDYVLVWKSVKELFLDHLKKTIVEFYGKEPQKSVDYGRIINVQHYDRILSLLQSGDVYHGGTHDRTDLFFSPTILVNVRADSPVMQEEIFGPILPVFEVNSIEEAVAFINSKPSPLAIYLFSGERKVTSLFIERTRSGSAIVNDCSIYPLIQDLPFGGIGASGIGKYHGKWGFCAYTNARSVFCNTTAVDPDVRYPPYSRNSWLRKLLLRFSV